MNPLVTPIPCSADGEGLGLGRKKCLCKGKKIGSWMSDYRVSDCQRQIATTWKVTKGWVVGLGSPIVR